MEYAKDEVFQVGYRTNLKRLELKEESLIKRLYRGAKRHKFYENFTKYMKYDKILLFW